MVGSSALPLYLCLFASGAAGLAYEVLWARILGQFLGHTVYALTTVLAAFMAGLALGSRLFGKISDRVDSPFRLYALLELGIGILCLAVPHLLFAARGAYLKLAPHLPSNGFVLNLARFALAMPVLLPPTMLMGGTIPAVCRHLVRASPEAGRTVGAAYAANTLGAAFGALSVGYCLVPEIGVRASNHIAVAVSVLAGATALLLATKARRAQARVAVEEGEEGDRRAATGDRLLVAAFAVSGAAGMAFEIVWSRALNLVIGSSTHAYSAILTIFLLGIGLGSALFAQFRLKPSAGLFGFLQIGFGIAAFLMVPVFDRLPGIFFALFKSTGGSFVGVLETQFVIVCMMLLPPMVLSGMTFPCAAGLYARFSGSLGGRIGRLYAWNTVGAIAGSCAAGLLLVPLLGAQRTLALAIGLVMLSGIAVVWQSRSPWRRRAAAAVAAAVVLAALYPRWDRRGMSSGVFYTVARSESMEDVVASRISEILYFREGVTSTISVARFATGVTGLLVNGKVDANNGGDMETQVKLANIPLLLHPAPGRVAVIGLGSGVTVGISTLYDAPREIDVVELEKAVVEASAFFGRESFGALKDPRVRLHIDDAASFIETAEPGYDVIISEPSNPWMAGVGNLYTREFFRKARGKLAEGGIYCQWIQGYAITPADFRLVLRTFLDVFPSSTLWTGSPGDFLLIGFRDGYPRPIDSRAIDARAFRNPRLRRSFRFLGDSPTDSMLASFFLDTSELRAYAGGGDRNTDDLPLLEFRAPASLYLVDSYQGLNAEMLARRVNSYPSFFRDPRYERPDAHVRLARLLERRNRSDEAIFHYRMAKGAKGTGPRNKSKRRA